MVFWLFVWASIWRNLLLSDDTVFYYTTIYKHQWFFISVYECFFKKKIRAGFQIHVYAFRWPIFFTETYFYVSIFKKKSTAVRRRIFEDRVFLWPHSANFSKMKYRKLIYRENQSVITFWAISNKKWWLGTVWRRKYLLRRRCVF